ncbi:hypothetical protein [Streptomyces sp. NPDC047028]|uniref:hypothetical protein n=1 Tax=Streptomyces sp. NPDC047028 TaxID=3155793 RepID=UPI00340A3833
MATTTVQAFELSELTREIVMLADTAGLRLGRFKVLVAAHAALGQIGQHLQGALADSA